MLMTSAEEAALGNKLVIDWPAIGSMSSLIVTLSPTVRRPFHMCMRARVPVYAYVYVCFQLTLYTQLSIHICS